MNRQAASQTHQAPAAAPPQAGGILQRSCDCGQRTIAGGECDECDKKQLSLQRATRNSELTTPNAGGAPPIVHEVLQSSGQPLDPATRASMEPRFGHDFSKVRVHADARASDSAQAVNALAYTAGHNMVFGTHVYEPGTTVGKRLLAHELTHTIQQANTFQSRLMIGHAGDQLEQEADLSASAIGEGRLSPIYGQARSGVTNQLMRQEAPKETAKTSLKDLKDGPPKKNANGPYLVPEVVITSTSTTLGRFSVRDVTFVKVEEPEDLEQRARRLNRQAEEEFRETIRQIQQAPQATISDASPEAALKAKEAANWKAQEELKRVFGEGWGMFFWWTRGGKTAQEGAPIWQAIDFVRAWNIAYPPQAYPSAPRVFPTSQLPWVPQTEVMLLPWSKR